MRAIFPGISLAFIYSDLDILKVAQQGFTLHNSGVPFTSNTVKTMAAGAGQHSLPVMPAKSLSIESLCYQDLHTALGGNAIDDDVENFVNQPR